ncbi:unnamed protein product [Rhodiola kirilowii]
MIILWVKIRLGHVMLFSDGAEKVETFEFVVVASEKSGLLGFYIAPI